jgi:hypothetical protein
LNCSKRCKTPQGASPLILLFLSQNEVSNNATIVPVPPLLRKTRIAVKLVDALRIASNQ